MGRKGRSLFQSAAVAVLLASIFLPARRSWGQTTGKGTASTGGNISMNGVITSSIIISVSGSMNATGGATTIISGSGTQGVVDFGTYNIPGPLLTGEKNRVNGATKGTYLVATLTVATSFSGGGSMLAAVDIQRTNPCGGVLDVPCGSPGSLFYAFMSQRKPKQPKLAWPPWSAYPQAPQFGVSVFSVPDSTYIPGAGNLDNLMANGDTLDHQVAVWIPDSMPPGPFATSVTYTATRL